MTERSARNLGLFMAGAALICVVIGVIRAHLQERRLATYVEAEAEIVSRRIDSWQTTNSKGHTSTKYSPVIEYVYTVGGQTYRSEQLGPGDMPQSSEFAERVYAQFPDGSRHPCWHDPDDPADAFLLREASFMPYIFVVVTSPFLAIGLLLVGMARQVSRRGLGLIATSAMAITFAFVVGHYRFAGGVWSTLAKVGVGIHLALLIPTAIVSAILAVPRR